MSHSEEREREREAQTSLIDDTADIGWRIIANLIDPELLRDIPVANWGVSILRAVETVHDRRLARRIGIFMHAVKNGLEPREFKDTISRLEASRHYAESVGEHLLEQLERMDSSRKAQMAAAVLNAFGKKTIDVDTYHRLVHAIDAMQLLDLPTLRNLYEEGPYLTGVRQPTRRDASTTFGVRQFTPRQESLQSLSAAGLVILQGSSAIGGSSPAWDLMGLGHRFVDLRLDLIEY
jgi:hypothetical protein